MKKLAIILLTTLVMPNVNAALSVSKTIAIHAPIPTSVTCNIQNYYCDIYTDNSIFKTVNYSTTNIPDTHSSDPEAVARSLRNTTCPLNYENGWRPYVVISDCNPYFDDLQYGCGVRGISSISGGFRIGWEREYYDGTTDSGVHHVCYYGSTATFYR